MEEKVVRFESEPTDEEWRAIRTFRHRANELATSSLVSGGYDLRANFAWKAGELPQFTVHALPAEEQFRSLLLTFRHFVGNDEPSNFLRVLNILSRHVPSGRDFFDGLRTTWNQALVGGLMNINFSGKELTAKHILDLWINSHYFHNDEAKKAELEKLSNAFTQDFVKFLLANSVTECCRAILQLSQALSKLANPKAAS